MTDNSENNQDTLRNLPITERELNNMTQTINALHIEIKGMKDAAHEIDKNMEIREEFYFNMKAKLKDGLLQLRDEVVAMDKKQKESDKRIEELEKENAKLTRQNEGMKNHMKKLQGNKKNKKEEKREMVIIDEDDKKDVEKLEKINKELHETNNNLIEENDRLGEKVLSLTNTLKTVKEKMVNVIKPKAIEMEKELEGKSESGKYVFHNCTVTFN